MDTNHVYDCIIIGGGISGLRCATLLNQSNKSILLLESRNRVGGRTCSKDINDYRWDVGGQWVGPSQKRIHRLIHQVNQSTFPQQEIGKKVLEINGKQSRYTGTIPPVSIIGLLEVQWILYRLERMSRMVDPNAPWQCKHANEWDATTFQQWIDANVWTTLTKKLIHVAIISVYSVDPKELSLLFVLFYFRTAGGVRRVIEVPDGAQQDRILGSAHQVSITMAERLGERIVKLDHQVSEIDQTTDDEIVAVKCLNGMVYQAKRIILTVPPFLIERIRFSPPLPKARQHLNQRMPMGQVIKFIIFYDTCFWRELGFAGEIVTDRESVSIAYDGSFEDGSRSSIVGFFEGNSAREWSDRSEEDRKNEVIDLLYKAFNDERAKHPTHYVDKDWMSDPDSLGGYTGVCGPGVLTTVGNAIRHPFDRVHFAGTETATEWTGYMEGALQSAERATTEIIDCLENQNKTPKSLEKYEYMNPLIYRGPKNTTCSLLSFNIIAIVIIIAIFINYLNYL